MPSSIIKRVGAKSKDIEKNNTDQKILKMFDKRKHEEDSQSISIKHARRINRKRSQIAEDAKHTYETAPNDRSVTHKYKEFLRIEARLAAVTDAYLGDR